MPSRETVVWYRPRLRLPRGAEPAGRFTVRLPRTAWRRAPTFASTVPVICIGNFTAGGTGKTPLAIALAQRSPAPRPCSGFSHARLRFAGPRAHSRRHYAAYLGGRRRRGAAAFAGRARHGISRPRGGRTGDRGQGLKCDLILMDDGFAEPVSRKGPQHRSGRTAAVGSAMVSSSPQGLLRAPLAEQLARNDVIVVNGRCEDRRTSHGRSQRICGAGADGTSGPERDTTWLSGPAVLAFAGIGNPQRFYHLLAQLGARVLAEPAFPIITRSRRPTRRPSSRRRSGSARKS